MPAWIGPSWRGERRNLFTDPEVVEAEKHLFTAIAKRLRDHPRFLGFDLGNELGVLQGMEHPAIQEAADAWARTMLAHCEGLAPGKLHVNGVDHVHWFSDFGFSRSALATTGAAAASTWPNIASSWRAPITTTSAGRYGFRNSARRPISRSCTSIRETSWPLWRRIKVSSCTF